MKMSKAKAISAVKQAIREQGLSATVDSFRWLGKWSPRRFGPGEFRCGVAVLALEDGRRVNKAFTAEDDGSWMIR